MIQSLCDVQAYTLRPSKFLCLSRKSFIWRVLSAQRHCVNNLFTYYVKYSNRKPLTPAVYTCQPLDGHVGVRAVLSAISAVSIRTVYGLSVYRQSPYSVRPWPYNGRCSALRTRVPDVEAVAHIRNEGLGVFVWEDGGPFYWCYCSVGCDRGMD